MSSSTATTILGAGDISELSPEATSGGGELDGQGDASSLGDSLDNGAGSRVYFNPPFPPDPKGRIFSQPNANINRNITIDGEILALGNPLSIRLVYNDDSSPQDAFAPQTVTLDQTTFGTSISTEKIPLEKDLFWVVEWTDTTKFRSRRVSGVFNVLPADATQDKIGRYVGQMADRIDKDEQLSDGFVEAVADGDNDLLPLGSRSDPLQSDSALSVSPPSATTSVPGSISPNQLGSGDSDSSKGGLSIGVKAGIGIGVAVAVLAIIGIIALMLLRRRRRARERARTTTYDPSTSSTTRGVDYLGEKEAHGMVVTDSPYTDDGRGSRSGHHHYHASEQQALVSSASGSGTGGGRSSGAFQPYSDAAPVGTAVTSDARVESRQGTRSITPPGGRSSSRPSSAGGGGPSTATMAPVAAVQESNSRNATVTTTNKSNSNNNNTPPSPTTMPPAAVERNIPSAMAHLVEEGMTEEQIRKLEEEERELDREIEQARNRAR